MTYTVIGRCERTGQTGIGIATASIAVGGLCPFYTPAGDIVTSQAFARPELGLAAVRHLAAGRSVGDLHAVLAEQDADFDFRQVAVLSRDGEFWVHSGAQCRPWVGHRLREYCAAMGNFLSGPAVVEAMCEAFEASASVSLAERLMRLSLIHI